MKNLSLVFIAALSLAAVGCKKKGGGDCVAALDHSMELAKGHSMAGLDDKTTAKLKDIGVQHCKDDKWSDDVLKCMMDAKSESDGQACYGKLTADQQQKMNDAAMAAMKTAVPATPPPTTGGDTGSAAAPAGSAAAPAGSAAAPAAAGSADTGSAAAPK